MNRACLMVFAAWLCAWAASGAGLENEYVAVKFGEKGEIASIRNKATGRELVKKPIPFAVVTLKDGKTKLEPARFAQKGDRLGWSFPGGGGLMLSVKPFAGGWTFTSEKFTVKDAESCEYFRMSLACDKYKGKYAHMMSDDEDAVCVRSYGLKLMMPDPGGQWGVPKLGHYLPVESCAEWGFTGHKCGLSAGPKGKIQKMLQAMTMESGAVMSKCGGAWCLGADENRHSYVFSYYDGNNFDEWLNLLELTGIGTIHFHLWYSSSGNYDNINTKKFPKGLAGLKEAADRVHAAGHRVSLHTLSALIAGPNPWVGTEANAGLQSVFQYTTLNDLKAGVTELRVKERPDDDMATSVTYGSFGNYLRLGSEIIQYTGIRREPPYAFTGVTRGSHKTKVVDHPAGTTAHYLRARYYGIYPDAEGPVMDEIAEKFAKVANTVGIDRVYFDGAEGIGPRYGRVGEYQIALMLNKLFERLDQSRHPIQAEVSCLNPYTWWMRANGGAIDGARYGRKIFDRDHLQRVAGGRASNLLEPQCGWWNPGQRTDETDYFMSHVAGVDGAMSLYGWVNETNKGPLGMHGQSELTVLGWYEHFRMALAFTDAALQKYRDLDSESRLRQDAAGVWQVEPYDCIDHRIDHAAKRRWTVERAAAGAAEPVIYVLGGSAPYDDPSAIPVVDGADAAAMAVKTSDRKISASVSSVAEKGRGDCFRLAAVNRSNTREKTWAHAALKFAKPKDCAPSDGVGFWVKGDGKGAMLNVRLHANGPQDCLVKLDFSGWRYFEFRYKERDCQTWSKYKWPVGGGWNQFTGNVDPKAVATVDVMLADIPVEGEKNVFLDENADAAMAAHEGVEVIVSQVRALPARAYEFTGMTLAVNGRRYALPFDAVASDDRIFLRDGYWTLRDGKGELKQKVKTSDSISLKAGANTLALVADAIEGELRADVTLLAFGEKFPALKPTAEWPKKWARHGMYEAMQPIEFCPRKGASELPNLTIRPGERAEIEVHLVGDAKSPWLEYASKDGMKRISLPDGHAGKRVKFKGPVLSGVRPLRFGCANSDSADVRIEIVKHYTNRPAADEPHAGRMTASAVDVAVHGTVAGDVKVSVPEPGGWKVSATQETADSVSVVTVRMCSPQAARPPKFTVSFARPGIGADHVWTPYDDRYMIRPHEWGATPYESQLAFRAPIAAAYRVNGENVLSLACSEAFDALKYGLTVGSSDCRLHGDVAFFTEYAAPRKTYEAKIRIDTRKVRWSQGVSDAAEWISRAAGLEPCRVPETARDPMYSTWYAFWQDVKADVLEREAPLAASLGMKAMILDDGWQKEKSRTYYSATGDWMPVAGRFPDMKAHVEKVHAAGLKYILWLSVPFVGDESAAYGRFKGKFLCEADEGSGTYVLDVRFPEVREYLIATYERAVRDWGFDGLKLDFIDMLKIPASGDPAEKDGWKGRDIRSLPVAVDTLMKDVRRRLTAINPDVLIEFRQQYMGPAIRQYGNMIRATDCPADSDKIRKLVCDLRLTSGTTAVHSDMLVWHPGETPERAARPILNALFSTIQYSMVLARLPAAHHEVIRHWLAFTQAHRATLLDGAFLPEHPEALYPLVAAESATERIAAAYTSGTVVPALAGGKTTWAINATDAAGLVVDAAEAGAAEIFDTFGKPCGKAAFGKGLVRLAVPPSGYVVLAGESGRRVQSR